MSEIMMIARPMPACPRCQLPDDVLSVGFHPDLRPAVNANGRSDGYVCTACAFAWPGDTSTPQEQPPRPGEGNAPTPQQTPARAELSGKAGFSRRILPPAG